MNVLFITVSRIKDPSERGIYTDLIRYFTKEKHQLFVVSPSERRYYEPTLLSEKDGIQFLNVKTLNQQKTNLVEKAFGSLLIEVQFQRAIKKYFSDIKFDLILYSTPPITLTKVVSYIKKRDNAVSYLMLKDIFPQNAVDLGFISKKGLIYSFFRKKEKNLYRVSNYIGCMSQANVDYILEHNDEISEDIVEVCPNSIEICKPGNFKINKVEERRKYGIPLNATIFIYGGNLGKPQGLDFLIKILKSNQNKENAFFVVIGSGTEFYKIQAWFEHNKPLNAILLSGLPKNEYNQLVQVCDVGLIFLNPRFTIPNYPSRLLTYLENKMPVLSATDKTTDIGSISVNNGFGLYSISGDLDTFNANLSVLLNDKDLISAMGKNGYDYLLRNYLVSNTYQSIMNHFN